MLNIKEYRSKDHSLADLLNIAATIGKASVLGEKDNCAIALNKDGSLMSAFRFQGPDLDTLSYQEINRISSLLNQGCSRLGTGWTVQDTAIRVPADGYIPAEESFFPDPVSRLIDEERRSQHGTEGQHFITRYYWIISWMTPRESEVAASSLFVEKRNKKDNALSFDAVIEKFTDTINAIVSVLRRSFFIEAMDDDALLTLVHECICGETHTVNAPQIPMYLDTVVGNHELVAGLEPQIDGKHIRAISLTGFPQKSRPDMIEALHNMPFSLRYTTRFIALDPLESKKLINKYHEHWMGARFSARDYLGAAISHGALPEGRASGDATNLMLDAKAAETEASQGVVRYGYFTATVILMDTDEDILSEKVRRTKALLDSSGFTAMLETVNSIEAWLGSLPGHTWENVRRPLMHSLNFADLSPKTSVWPGAERCPSPLIQLPDGGKAPPLTFAQTSGATPFRLNLHVRDLGHTLLIGPTGAGKSTALALIALQWLRYKDARVIAFDKGRSMYAATKAVVGGSHYDIAGELSDLTFAPLQRITESALERGFSEDWVASLAILQGVTINPQKQEIIHQAIEALSGEEGRSLTDLKSLLQDEDLKAAINFYTGTGRTGSLLDARKDTLNLQGSNFICFEMENLLQSGETAKKITVPTLLYLFHRIEKMLDGRPTLIPLDEAWVMIDNPQFLAVIKEWLKELRKKNGIVLFATQSLKDLQGSPLLPVLMESCPTKIFLPNGQAEKKEIRPLYEEFGLQDRQIELLANAIPKQDYYIVSEVGQRMVNFDFGPIALAFTGVSDPRDVKRVAELSDTHGEQWPLHWLNERLPNDIKESWLDYAKGIFTTYGRAVA